MDWGFYLYFLLQNWFSNEGIVNPTSACRPTKRSAEIIEVSEKGKKEKTSFSPHGEVLACSVDVYDSIDVYDTQVYPSLVTLFPSSW